MLIEHTKSDILKESRHVVRAIYRNFFVHDLNHESIRPLLARNAQIKIVVCHIVDVHPCFHHLSVRNELVLDSLEKDFVNLASLKVCQLIVESLRGRYLLRLLLHLLAYNFEGGLLQKDLL